MPDGIPRGIVREPRFEREAVAIEPNVRRMDEALDYVERQLARWPETGIESSVPGIWVAPTRVPSGRRIIRVSVFYTFDAQYVRLQSILRAP